MPAGKGYMKMMSIDSGPMVQGGGIRPPGQMARTGSRQPMGKSMRKGSMKKSMRKSSMKRR